MGDKKEELHKNNYRKIQPSFWHTFKIYQINFVEKTSEYILTIHYYLFSISFAKESCNKPSV